MSRINWHILKTMQKQNDKWACYNIFMSYSDCTEATFHSQENAWWTIWATHYWEGAGTCCCCACYNTSKGTVNAYRRWCKCWAGLSFFPFFTLKMSKPSPSLCYPCAELHTRELSGCISSSQLSCLDGQAAKMKKVNTMKDSYVYTELICKCVYLNKELQFAVHCVYIPVHGRLIKINIILVLPGMMILKSWRWCGWCLNCTFWKMHLYLMSN